jgi:hypothetical protein
MAWRMAPGTGPRAHQTASNAQCPMPNGPTPAAMPMSQTDCVLLYSVSQLDELRPRNPVS